MSNAIPCIAAERLAAFIFRTFAAVGMPAGDVQSLAGLMVEADLRGSDTHGVIRLPLYVRRLRRGREREARYPRGERPTVGGLDRRR